MEVWWVEKARSAVEVTSRCSRLEEQWARRAMGATVARVAARAPDHNSGVNEQGSPVADFVSTRPEVGDVRD